MTYKDEAAREPEQLGLFDASDPPAAPMGAGGPPVRNQVAAALANGRH